MVVALNKNKACKQVIRTLKEYIIQMLSIKPQNYPKMIEVLISQRKTKISYKIFFLLLRLAK